MHLQKVSCSPLRILAVAGPRWMIDLALDVRAFTEACRMYGLLQKHAGCTGFYRSMPDVRAFTEACRMYGLAHSAEDSRCGVIR
jgi:hypothetical protein